jgi:hypothetical protein
MLEVGTRQQGATYERARRNKTFQEGRLVPHLLLFLLYVILHQEFNGGRSVKAGTSTAPLLGMNYMCVSYEKKSKGVVSY